MSPEHVVSRFRVRPAEPRDCPEILRLIKNVRGNEYTAWEGHFNEPGITYLPTGSSIISKELAAYENMPNAVKITETDLLRDGFGSRPFFHCLVAEVSKQEDMQDADVVGFAMYYYTYDPWIGRLLYLEDFYVMDEFRGWGIGTELLKRLSQIAIETHCNCMHFLVVVWNKPSIEYYMRRGASDLSTEEGWHLFRFDKENLIRMASGE